MEWLQNKHTQTFLNRNGQNNYECAKKTQISTDSYYQIWSLKLLKKNIFTL